MSQIAVPQGLHPLRLPEHYAPEHAPVDDAVLAHDLLPELRHHPLEPGRVRRVHAVHFPIRVDVHGAVRLGEVRAEQALACRDRTGDAE